MSKITQKQKQKTNYSLAVVITVLNEAKTIDILLESLACQTLKPKEIIVVDAGSDDGTWDKLQAWQKKLKNLRIYYQEGNRSVGRNLGVKKAIANFIAFTDAGCIPHKDWLKELVRKKDQTKAGVVAGYYQGKGKTSLENAIIPYALVMPDKVDKTNFLPATRSMLIKKSILSQVGGFDESLDFGEDYDLALRLKQKKIKMVFAQKAVVDWYPRTSLVDFAVMILDFAFWDAKAGHLRKKVKLLFVRYIFFFLLVSMWIETQWWGWLLVLFTMLAAYTLWSISKNKKYVPTGWWWLPVLQIVSDIMVLGGTMLGWVEGKRTTSSLQEDDN